MGDVWGLNVGRRWISLELSQAERFPLNIVSDSTQAEIVSIKTGESDMREDCVDGIEGSFTSFGGSTAQQLPCCGGDSDVLQHTAWKCYPTNPLA